MKMFRPVLGLLLLASVATLGGDCDFDFEIDDEGVRFDSDDNDDFLEDLFDDKPLNEPL